MAKYNSIGKLAATFGVKGELVLVHHLGQKTALKGVQAIFIEFKRDELLPYFVEETRVKNDTELFIKLEGINSKEEARNYLQKQVWLPEETVLQFSNKTAPISFLGFHIIDNGTDIGEILEVIEQPHQMLCRIDLDGKEALIPMHQETLLKVDKKKKEVHVQLPDGLLDIFR
ncbi:MAG: 16S rRNA processing protein RimM [Chitinophagaceae bacterium]|nr:16S rRNA processing protein RimM [Chitinophagaceae bacterium]